MRDPVYEDHGEDEAGNESKHALTLKEQMCHMRDILQKSLAFPIIFRVMEFASFLPYLEEARLSLEAGEVLSAQTYIEAGLADVDGEPVYEGWNYDAPPLEEGVLDFLTKNKSIHKLAKHAGIHTQTNVRDDLQGIHHAGQNAIAMSDRAHQYNKGATSKHTMDHPDQDVSMAQHHSAIKAHQAVLGKLDAAHKNAVKAGDHDAAAWISQAKDVHTQHRDWNMKMARNQRFGGPLGQQMANQKQKGKLDKIARKDQRQKFKKSLKGQGQEQGQPAAASPPPAGNGAAPGIGSPSAPARRAPSAPMAKPMAGKGTVNPQTGQRIGQFNPQTGLRNPTAGVPNRQANPNGKKKNRPMQAAESVDTSDYVSILESIR